MILPEYIDSHCHLTLEHFAQDREDVLEKMEIAKVWGIGIGCDSQTSAAEVALAEKNQGYFAMIGQHPVDKYKSAFDEPFFTKLLQSKKVVGIGECGLDFSKNVPDGEEVMRQIDLFEKHIELALRFNKPLMLHCRGAYSEALAVLESYAKREGAKLRGDVHFFAGDVSIAERFLNIGFHISFTGPITFSDQYNEVVRYVPLDRILSETDAPFAAPAPHRGKRNEPIYVREIVHKIAELKERDSNLVKAQLVKNTLDLFLSDSLENLHTQ